MLWNDRVTASSSSTPEESLSEYPSGNITVRLTPVISSMAPIDRSAVGGVKYAESAESGLGPSYSRPEDSYKEKDQNVANTLCVLSLPLPG